MDVPHAHRHSQKGFVNDKSFRLHGFIVRMADGINYSLQVVVVEDSSMLNHCVEVRGSFWQIALIDSLEFEVVDEEK